jgi:ferredoxin-type protein NapH
VENESVVDPRRYARNFQKSRFTSLLAAGFIFLLMAFMAIGQVYQRKGNLLPPLLYTIFLTALTFLMFRKGMVSRYRSIFFATYAIAFCLVFIPNLLETRGSMLVNEQDVANLDVPFCHIVLPMVVLPAAFYKVLIFPTKILAPMGFLPMLFLWLGATLTIGKGWCSWGCFYGGIDEFFSKLLRKAKLKPHKWGKRWRLVPYAVLVLIVFWALIALEPVYCTWLCPWKAVTEFPEPNNALTYFQTGLFASIFLGLVVVLPLFSKARTQCGLFCPFGAFQGLVGVVNPYRVKIDKDLCNNCGKCRRVCPLFAITDDTLRNHKMALTCARCGRCVDECPNGAIQFSMIGYHKPEALALTSRPQSFFSRASYWMRFHWREIFEPRALFLITAITFGGIMGAGFFTNALERLWHLVTHGSLLLK